MRKKFFTVAILIAVALCPVYARAQQDSSTSRAKDGADAALRAKAYELLESLAGQLGTMQSPENRARIGSNIAWSLWPHNETRAREVLAAVQQDINAGLQVPPVQDVDDVHDLMVFLKLRADTIDRIAQRDPELAYEFFKATALSPDLKLSDEARAGEHALETQLARQVAASNPDLSLQLARKLLARGFSDELIVLVGKLNRKHKEQAKALYKDIVQKLVDSDFKKDWAARYFALRLAHSFAPPEVNEADFTELVNLFTKAAVESGCMTKMSDAYERADICRLLAAAAEPIAKINPSRAKQLEQWKVEGEYEYWRRTPYSEVEETAEEGTVDDVLALTAKHPEITGEIYWRAFRKAAESGDFERARKIANDFTRDPEQQQLMLAELKVVQPSVNDELIAEVMKRLDKVKGTDQRAMYLTAIASQLGEKDRQTAIKLLNQANQMIDGMKPGRKQTTSRLALALVYCQHKSDRGFAIMESLLPKLNELIEASVKLDGYETRYVREGEWNMTGQGLVGQLLTWLAQNAGYFAWCDFDRAVTLAGQFERTEIRMMAQLKLAQGSLTSPPKPFLFRYQSFIY